MIIMLEVTGTVLFRMDEKQFHNQVIDLITEIKIITGVFLYPDGTIEQQAQAEMIKRLLMRTPKYMRLTAAEVAQAFYMNASGYYPETYRHYNRELNAEFFGDILNAYINYKKKFATEKRDMFFRSLNPHEEPPIPVITVLQWKQFIQEDLQKMIHGQQSLIFNCTPKYFFLRRMGYITLDSRDHWWRWYRYAVEQRQREVLRTAAETEGAKASKRTMLGILGDILEAGTIPARSHRGLVHLTRRTIYLSHLRAVKEYGATDIFSQISPV